MLSKTVQLTIGLQKVSSQHLIHIIDDERLSKINHRLTICELKILKIDIIFIHA